MATQRVSASAASGERMNPTIVYIIAGLAVFGVALALFAYWSIRQLARGLGDYGLDDISKDLARGRRVPTIDPRTPRKR